MTIKIRFASVGKHLTEFKNSILIQFLSSIWTICRLQSPRPAASNWRAVPQGCFRTMRTHTVCQQYANSLSEAFHQRVVFSKWRAFFRYCCHLNVTRLAFPSTETCVMTHNAFGRLLPDSQSRPELECSLSARLETFHKLMKLTIFLKKYSVSNEKSKRLWW